MTSRKRRLCVGVAFFVFASAPGLPAYCALAQDFAGPAEAAPPSWIPALGAVSMDLASKTDAASQNLYGVLGQVQLEAELSPQSRASLAFAAQLPVQADTPEKLMALPASLRLELVSRAVLSASNKLSAQAAPIAEKLEAGQQLSAAEKKTLSGLAHAWFYLPPQQARTIREAALERSGQGALNKAKAMANALAGALLPVGTSDQDIEAGVSMTFARLKPLVSRNLDPNRVREVLAPEAVAALSQASQSLKARGWKEDALWSFLLQNHRRVFGALADEKMVSILQEGGQWTELVSVLSLTAAGVLARENAAWSDAVLRDAGADYDLRLPIPAWHPLSGHFDSVADALASSYGAPTKDEQLELGALERGAGRIFGVPLTIGLDLLAAPILFAQSPLVQLMSGAAIGAQAINGIVSAILVYGTILAHELGHTFMAKALGVRVKKISLSILKGETETERIPLKPLERGLLSFAGPAVNLAIIALCLLPIALHIPVPHLLAKAMASALLINVFLAMANLAPMFPMDGATVLEAVLSAVLRSARRGAQAAKKASKATAFLAFAAAGVFLLTGLLRFALGSAWFGATGLIQAKSDPKTTLVEETPGR